MDLARPIAWPKPRFFAASGSMISKVTSTECRECNDMQRVKTIIFLATMSTITRSDRTCIGNVIFTGRKPEDARRKERGWNRHTESRNHSCKDVITSDTCLATPHSYNDLRSKIK